MATIPLFTKITIDGTEVIRPNEFTLQRENVYAAEIETCTGKRIADLIGWRYSDLTLNFDWLPQDELSALLAIQGEVSMTFGNEVEETVTEQVIVRTSTATVTRLTDPDGNVAWKGINLEVQFINAHPNTEG